MTDISTTSIAKLIPGKVSYYDEWGPEIPLRFICRQGSDGAKYVLQQRWVRHGYDTTGALCTGEIEWRDVPLESE